MSEAHQRASSLISSLRRYWAWAQKGSWAVMDQALFAGSNFLVGLLLARWLAPAAYGAFSTAYTVFLLLATLHNALWIDPMTVYGSGRFRTGYIEYQRILLKDHWRLGAAIFGAFLAVGIGFLTFGQDSLGRSFLGLAAASPLILFLWLARRGAYVAMEPRLATFGGALYLALYFGFAIALMNLGWLNETSALVAMGLASWISGQWILSRYRRHAVPARLETSPAEVRSLHWGYGRWALLTALFSWAPANLLFLLLPFFETLENIGGLRAILTIFQPPIQVNSALAALLVTMYTSLETLSAKRKLTLAAGAALGAITAVYCVLILVFGKTVVPFLLGSQYEGYLDMFITPLATLALLTVPIGALTSYFKALEQPQVITRVMFLSAVMGAALSVAVLPLAGAVGAAWVMTATYAAITINFLWRWIRNA